MSQRNRRTGKALRVLLVVILLLISVPAVWIGARQVSSVQADDKRHQRMQSVTLPIETTAPQPLTESGVQYRPVIETSYRDEIVTIRIPELDLATGKQVLHEREQVRKVPVQTTRWVKSYVTNPSGSPHNQQIMQLAGELREMKQDDESRDAKLRQLRTRLELEFSQLHENQSAEIKRTETRLESLRKVHQQRGENKDKIVQRRIDELLGKADVFGWNPVPLNSQSTTLSNHVGQSPTNLAPQLNPGSGDSLPFSRVIQPNGSSYGYSLSTQQAPPRLPIFDPFSRQPIQPSQIPSQRIPPPPSQLFPSSQYLGAPDTASDVGPRDTSTDDHREPTTQVNPTADAVPSTDYRLAPSSGTAQVRVGTPRSALGEVFYLARSKSNANAELAEAEYKYLRYKELRDKGAIPIFEFKEAESAYEKCKREVKLIDMQLEAFSDAMQRVKELAKSTHERALSNLAATEAGTKRGVISQQELVDAKFEVEKSRIELADASENISRLNEAMEAVKAFDKQESDPTADVESADSDKSSDAERP